MSSRSPGWFGFTRPWIISRWLPSMRSTMRRTLSADSISSGEASRRDGTNDSTIMSVSLSRNTSFTNSSDVRQARWLRGVLPSASAQPALGDQLNADSGATLSQASVGST